MSADTEEMHDKIDQYRQAVATAALCAQLLSQHDIPKLLAAIEHADVFGPMLDPTLWRDKHKAMEEDRELLRAANKLRAHWMDLKAKGQVPT